MEPDRSRRNISKLVWDTNGRFLLNKHGHLYYSQNVKFWTLIFLIIDSNCHSISLLISSQYTDPLNKIFNAVSFLLLYIYFLRRGQGPLKLHPRPQGYPVFLNVIFPLIKWIEKKKEKMYVTVVFLFWIRSRKWLKHHRSKPGFR